MPKEVIRQWRVELIITEDIGFTEDNNKHIIAHAMQERNKDLGFVRVMYIAPYTEKACSGTCACGGEQKREGE